MEQPKSGYEVNIDLDTFVIPRDRDRDYRRRNCNEESVPPYDHYRFKSIYEGIMIEMHIVDHCNLNCVSCNHFAPLAKPWFITKESFSNSLNLIKENIPNMKSLILLGGEPTLHPELLELCKIARNIMPNIEISILSNGKNLSQVLIDAKEYQDLRIGFGICDYPGYTNKDQVQQAIDMGVASYCNTRLLMYGSLVNQPDRIEDPILNFYNCTHHMLPCFTVEDDKLFLCPFASHSKHYFRKCKQDYPITEFDYLNIADIQGDIELLQTFIFTPKPICSYCRHDGEFREFKKSTRTTDEYCYTLPELYTQNYEIYESLIKPTQSYFTQCLNNKDKNYLHLEDEDSSIIHKLLTRYNTGKIDIIIPYYNVNKKQLEQLEKTLLSQTIIDDCMIYMISDNSPNEEDVFHKFYNHSKLNCIMLKNLERQGPGAARNKGIEFSCNDYIFMLDADDYFSSTDDLEYLYNLAIQDPCLDVIQFTMPEDDTKASITSIKSNYLLKRQFCDNHSDIKFPPYFYGEDFWFFKKLYKYRNNNNFKVINKSIGWYGTYDNPKRLTVESEFDIPLVLSKLLYTLYDSEVNFLEIFEENFINEYEKFLTNKESEYMRVLIFYIFNQIYKIKPSLLNNIDITYLVDLQNNIIAVPTKNKILRTEEDLKEYLYKNLDANSIFIKPLIQDLDLIDFYKK